MRYREMVLGTQVVRGWGLDHFGVFCRWSVAGMASVPNCEWGRFVRVNGGQPLNDVGPMEIAFVVYLPFPRSLAHHLRSVACQLRSGPGRSPSLLVRKMPSLPSESTHLWDLVEYSKAEVEEREP